MLEVANDDDDDEVWGLNVHERKQIEAVEINCLRNICEVRGSIESEIKRLGEDEEKKLVLVSE